MTRSIHRKDVGARILTSFVLLLMLVSFVGVGFAAPSVSQSSEATGVAPAPEPEPDAEVALPPAEDSADEPPADDPKDGDDEKSDDPADASGKDAKGEEPPAEEPPADKPSDEPVVELSIEPKALTDMAVGTFTSVSYTPTAQGKLPTWVSGNPTCSSHEWSKIDDTPSNGTYTTFDDQSKALPAGASIKISNATDYSFDFQATGIKILSVIVKAANGANIYSYEPNGVTWDKGLQSVMKDDETGFHQISHVTFCWEAVEEPPVGPIDVKKFHDQNDDGEKQESEPYLEGFQFELYSGASESGPWTLEDTKVSDSNGKAAFGNWPQGWYKIVEVLSPAQIAAGWANTTSNPVIFFHDPSVTTTGLSVDCEPPPPTGTTKLFGNNIQEHEKTFRLSYEGQQPANTTFYVTYFVDGEPAPKLALTGSDPFTAKVTLSHGSVISKVVWWASWEYASGQFADIILGTTKGETLTEDKTNRFTYGGLIDGYKYEDLNANGIKEDGEPALQGWKIILEYKVGSSWYKVGERTTNSSGYYRFYSPFPGEYRVSETLQAGWTQSFPTDPDKYHYCTLNPIDNAGTLSADCVGTKCRDKNFLNWRPASIEGVKFNDLNADGDRDDGEPGLEGWYIYVDYDGDNVADPGEPYDVTDANGDYYITGIKPGTYAVREVLIGGWFQSLGSSYVVTFESGKHYGGEGEYDFGNWTEASKSGMKFHDLDADGVKDPGEPGLSGWTIFVDVNGNGQFDSGEPSDVTDEFGAYKIENVPLGTYKVYEVMQSGWTQTYPADGYYEVTFTSGMEDRGNDFGNWKPAKIVGMKFHDLDADGTNDDEPGLEGWTIFVDYDGDGVLDSDEPSDTTGPDGAYEIDNVKPGTYWVREINKTDWTQSRGDFQVTFASSGVYGEEGEYEFGNWTTTYLGGLKFYDKNGNGVNDNEPGLKGWTIHLVGTDSAGNAVSRTTSTTANGTYTFSNLPPGTYMITETLKPGWVQSYPASGFHNTTLESGTPPEESYDFGNWNYIDPRGYKFHDLNANGDWDPDEPGLGGWEITLVGTDGMGHSVNMTTTTAADGSWSFPHVPPGTYTISEVNQTGWTQTFPAPPGTHGVTLVSGEDPEEDFNFGNYTTGKKYGTKFEDLNADGDRDPGEPGLSNWLIFVDYDNDGIADLDEPQALTAVNGTYELTGIEPGTWWIREVMKTDFDWTQSMPGSSDFAYQETFESGTEFENNDFGNWAPAEITGMKFEDLNANGKNDDEPGLENWRIYVDYDGNDAYDAGEPTALTDANGDYKITGIKPGTYEVREVLETDWNQSRGNFEVTFESRGRYGGEGKYDFGNWYESEKSGTKFEDLNANGAKDSGEPGLGGWTIFVDYNGNKALDSGEPSAVTASDGTYQITGIKPGTYMVYEVMKTDYDWTQSMPGSPDFGYQETFTSSSSMVDNDFGNWAPASIKGLKFHDLNADGEKGPNELGLAGWTIFVDYDGEGDLDANEPRDITDANGEYEITGVKPGTYWVLEVNQNDWYQSLGDYQVTFESRGEYGGEGDYDFGNYQFTEVWGYKIHDLNADGVLGQEPGLENWEIHLDGTAGTGEAIHRVTYTDANGYYEFTNLPPGQYVISEVIPAGWTQSYPTDDNGTWPVEPYSGFEQEVGYDFGNWTTATKYGTKFFDVDGDGEPREEGEEGLEGWTIYVDYNDNSVLDNDEPSTTTDADGNYELTGIVPGTWKVREVQSDSDWMMTFPAAGFYSETFTSGAEKDGNDFGNTTKVVKTFELTFTSGAPANTDFFVKFMVDGEATQASLVASTSPNVYTVESEMWPQTVISNVEWFASWGGDEIKLGDGIEEETIVEDMINEFDYDAAVYGSKWNDTDFETGEPGDGIWDKANEDVIEGFTIQLYRQNGVGQWVLYGTTKTGADGSYDFSSVLPGKYYLAELIPEAGGIPLWIQSAGPNGEGDLAISVANGSMAGPIDFGNYEPFAPFTLDMGLQKTVSKSVANPGDTLTYTLTYTMVEGAQGPLDTWTVVDDYNEKYMTVVDAAGGTVADGKITWTFNGPLAEGESGTITYKLKVADSMPDGRTQVDNAAVVDTDGDTDPDNNRDTASVAVDVGEPFLPFTGGTAAQLLALAGLLALGGVSLRRVGRKAA